ncbi:hypothetical protein ACFXJ5_29365 [Streptomyces sp. NPDC059373]
MVDYRLSHPLYLDVQMMVSFLAYLEGGVYVTTEETMQTEQAKDRRATGSGKLKLPSLGALLGLEASVNAELGGHTGESAEIKVARHHTAASLFNALYEHLSSDAKIKHIGDTDDLRGVKSGDFVEVSGRYTGNPLEETLAVFTRFFEYLEELSEKEGERSSKVAKGKRSGNPQSREEASTEEGSSGLTVIAQQFNEMRNTLEFTFFLKMKQELENSPIHDVVLEAGSGLRTVLTVSSDYYNPAVGERLKSGDFNVLGKVTRILRQGESINLSRRTVIGATEGDESNIAASLAEGIPGLNQHVGSPIVGFPAIQILPMAIFV